MGAGLRECGAGLWADFHILVRSQLWDLFDEFFAVFAVFVKYVDFPNNFGSFGNRRPQFFLK